jgi:hypothetical protein
MTPKFAHLMVVDADPVNQIPLKYTFGAQMISDEMKILALVISNLGVIITVIGAIVRFTWFLGRLDHKVDTNNEKHAKDINAAHEKIRDVKNETTELRQQLISLLQNQK